MSERERLATRRPALEARARILRAVRDHFAAQGFLEVETPARVFSPGQEVHLDAIATDGGRHLITSPEYHMKRLVGAGYPRIFQIARSFRAGETGPHHQPEFAMVEWYRARQPLEALMDDCEALLRAAALAAGSPGTVPVPAGRARRPDEALDVFGPFERVTVSELLMRHAGVRLRGDESAAELVSALRAAGHPTPEGLPWDDAFFQVFLDRVEPHLGRGRPTFVVDWPLPLAALARRKPGNAPVAERFELYAGGLELANAFGELTDPVEQRARFVAESADRKARGKAVYPLDERLLEALPHMPETAGIALGFDRLVMLVTGSADIRQVIAFADDEV